MLVVGCRVTVEEAGFRLGAGEGKVVSFFFSRLGRGEDKKTSISTKFGTSSVN